MGLCFYCFAVLSDTAEYCPACGAPTFVMTTQGKRQNVRRLGTCLTGNAPGVRAERISTALRNLPRQVDLRPHCSAVEDQGQVGSCAANAAVGAFEHYLRKQGKPATELSRLFVYFNGRMIGGHVTDDGIRIAEAMAALVAQGAPEESRWPYLPEMWNTRPSKEAYDWAWGSKPNQFASIPNGDGVRGALARSFPVVINILLSMQSYQEGAKSGVLRAPTDDERKAGKYPHAMLIVGYDLDKEEYIIRNSWGANWGDKGYCRASFSTVDTHSWPDENWILGSLDAMDDRTSEQAPAASAAPTPPDPSSVAGMAAKMREDIRSSLTKDIADATKDIRERMKPKPPGQN